MHQIWTYHQENQFTTIRLYKPVTLLSRSKSSYISSYELIDPPLCIFSYFFVLLSLSLSLSLSLNFPIYQRLSYSFISFHNWHKFPTSPPLHFLVFPHSRRLSPSQYLSLHSISSSLSLSLLLSHLQPVSFCLSHSVPFTRFLSYCCNIAHSLSYTASYFLSLNFSLFLPLNLYHSFSSFSSSLSLSQYHFRPLSLTHPHSLSLPLSSLTFNLAHSFFLSLIISFSHSPLSHPISLLHRRLHFLKLLTLSTLPSLLYCRSLPLPLSLSLSLSLSLTLFSRFFWFALICPFSQPQP
ncbi:unnamed protein product [Acanthosepion pharaonis]|uniref:Uncharacterized protein n=1 Tax=Acanthosepion pharaonis TaxID=158019 RepID=A0A812BW77_ACAPH|nr:unnamed protein product [Sepia pharaonis]